jgi:hypothetical protein
MRIYRFLATILGIMLVFDVSLAFWLWKNGWPHDVNATTTGSISRIEFVPVAFRTVDWMILALLICLQIGLGCLVWRLRRLNISRRI